MSTQERWSRPVEALRDDHGEGPLACDVLVVGSGYGGSIAAAELAAPGRTVWVMERGREYALGDFPEDIGQLPGHVRYQSTGRDGPIGNADALLDFRLFDQVGVLVANGLGGGSLINAGVALQPGAEVFDDAAWPAHLRQDGEGRRALFAAMAEVAGRLEAAPVPQGAALPKFRALDRLGAAMHCAPAETVPVTITHADRVNAQGLPQAACIRCGNCFTGCNQGAKNSLPTNLIPQAARAGAQFFTGATAVEVEPLPGPARRWRVHFALTARIADAPGARHFCVDAHTVVLAAGTLGSTELLLRSPRVSTSAQLGRRFSANGDAIAMGWGHRTAVHGMSAPRPDSTQPSRDVGPTIVGAVRAQVPVPGGTRAALVQDGAVPSALSMAVVALGSTLSSLHRYTEGGTPAAHGSGAGADVLATPAAIGEHALLLLAMGRDDADGVIGLHPATGRLEIGWPGFSNADGSPGSQGGRAAYYEGLHAWFEEARRRQGFDGGDYLPNPAWRPVPDKFSGLTGGSQPERLVTVHPLGGCAMADDAAHGVVDRDGTVFDPRRPGAVHAGLHVLDGAIVPCAPGVNPFLTIGGLCLVAARRIRGALAAAPQVPTPRPTSLPTLQPRVELPAFQGVGPVVLGFEERLQSVAGGTAAPAWLEALLPAAPAGDADPAAPRQWVAVVSLDMDVHGWLADPSRPLPARLAIYRNPHPGSPTVRDEVLDTVPVLQGTGTVSLLALDAPASRAEEKARTREAFATWLARRGTQDLSAVGASGQGPFEGLRLFWRAACNHAAYRELRYAFTLAPPSGQRPRVQATGRKRLAYRRDERTVWEALTRLDLRLEPGADRPAWTLALAVDLADLVKGRRLQVKQAPNTPAVIVAMAGFFALWARALLRTQFWSFRGLSYDELAPPAVPAPPPLRPGGPLAPAVLPHIVPLTVPGGHGRQEPVALELVRYVPADARHGSILLVHGLAHGSGVFTTDTVGSNNLATHFLREGYTVWLLDHRLSNRLRYANDPHTMDDVARHDIAHAVRAVHAASGAPIDVFAHCVGAGAFAMSVLSGATPGAMVRAAILHAVHPWVVPSASNRFSAALAALYKDLLPAGLRIDPVPRPKEGGALHELLDRFAASLPWPEAQRHDHEAHKHDRLGGYAVCNRMTVFYGREWEHGNLDPRTHDRLGELVGVAGLEVFRQLFFVLNRERLTDRQGANVYLTQAQVRERWTFPTLFAHGGRNRVFDARSAVRSWERITAVLRGHAEDRAMRLFVREGYGHMDFLFGRHAHRDVYPALSRFLAEPAAFESTVGGAPAVPQGEVACDGEDLADPEFLAPVVPLCGPMLQLEEGAGGRRLVLWFEQRFDTTSEPVAPALYADGVEIEDATVLRLPGHVALAGLDAGARTAVNAGAGHYWTVVVPDTAGRLRKLQSLVLVVRTVAPGVPTPLGAPAAAGTAPSATPAQRIRIGGVEIPLPDGVWNVQHPGVLESLRKRLEGALSFLSRPGPPGFDGPPPFDSRKPVVMALGGLPWWRRWVGEATAAPVSVLAASCRWPGTPFEQQAADRLAAAMATHVQHAQRPADGLVLLGDQIYADATANVAETTEASERRQQRYRDAWHGDAVGGTTETARLLRALPTWLVVDDHEYRENQDGWAGPGDQEFADGFDAAFAYQWRWHRPEAPCRPDAAGGTVRGFWHDFRIGGMPAFAADTRSEREPRDGPDWMQARLVGAAQMEALQRWLVEAGDGPKLLCCGSVFGLPGREVLAQPALARYADDWCGYPAAWQELARFIAAQRVRNLVVLAGDYHLSALAELEIRSAGAPAARVVSVVASGWNATLPFANPRPSDQVWDTPVRLPCGCPSLDVWSRARLLGRAQRQFTKLSFVREPAGWVLEAQSHGVDGPLGPLQRVPL